MVRNYRCFQFLPQILDPDPDPSLISKARQIRIRIQQLLILIRIRIQQLLILIRIRIQQRLDP
jgi:hypothetical protein